MGLPFVTVFDQLLLIVEQLFVEERRVLVVGALDDGINRAGLLAETAEDALGHVDIVFGGATRAIRTWLRLNDDSECRASSLAQLASDATLFARRVTTQGMLATEHG